MKAGTRVYHRKLKLNGLVAAPIGLGVDPGCSVFVDFEDGETREISVHLLNVREDGAGWTPEDQREFDRLVTLMDSIRQMDRINGRIQWPKFEARFTKAQLDEMWAGIKGK